MSSYFPSFNYQGINSREKNLVISHFDADQGEADTFLGMESIYTESADGSSRLDYGAKFNNVATFRITMIKQNGEDFSVADVRDCLKWLTGVRRNSPLDLTEHFIESSNDADTSLKPNGVEIRFQLFHQCDYAYYVKINGNKIDNWTIETDGNASFLVFDTAPTSGSKIEIAYNRIKYSFIGRVTNAWQHKLDARTVGIILEFTSSSPWAFSRTFTVEQDIYGTESAPATLLINNESDEQYSWLYFKTTYTNADGVYLRITNNTTGEMTYVGNIGYNEKITIDGNKMITSSNKTRIFGNDFNFNFPRLCSGINTLQLVGDGHIKIEYIMPLKAADCAMDISALSDPVCNELGEVVLDTLDWSRITNTPSTLGGYGIVNAYTKSEVDTQIANMAIKEISWSKVTHKPTNLSGFGLDDEVYTKDEVDTMLESFVSDEVYTKQETDSKISSVNKQVASLSNKLVNEYFNTTYIKDHYYDKDKIDYMISQLTYDPETGIGASVLWAQIVDKPSDLTEYGVKTEVQEMIDAATYSLSVEIDEVELNAMLDEILV